MKILLVIDNFYPEIGSASQVYNDLGKAFVKRNHDVHVITMYPRNFYLSQDNSGKVFPIDETIEGMHVHRCRFHFAQRDNVLMRGLEHFLVPGLYFNRYKTLGIKFDGIIFYIPPLLLYRMANMIRKYDGTRSVLNFQDIHPQELVDVGMVKNPLIIRLLKYLEMKAYKTADYITVLSPSGVNLILTRGGNSDRIQCIYNGIDLAELDKNFKRKDFKNLEGIENKILVSYAGMINVFQGIDDILDVAKRFKEDNSMIFYIVGDGMETKRLKKRLSDEGISNVLMKPLQPKDVYYNIVNSSDINIVSLDSRMTAPCLPGKFANLLAAGRPILAKIPRNNDIFKIVKDIKCGIAIEPDNISEFEEAIRKLKANLHQVNEMGRNGRKFFEENMNLENNAIIYEHIFSLLKSCQ